MALFDKLKNAFSKKKETPAPAAPAVKEWPRPEEPDPAAPVNPQPAPAPQPALTAEQVIFIARSLPPANEFTLSGARAMLDYAAGAVGTLDTVKLTGPGLRLMQDDAIPANEFLQVIGGVYGAVESMLKITRIEKVRVEWAKTDTAALLNGLKGLSHFADNTEKTPSTRSFRDALAEHLRTRLTEADFEAAQARDVLNKIETLQLKYAIAARNDKNDPKLPEIAQEICMNLRMADAFYAAYDEDFNPRWPYMGPDGRPEVFTTPELAEAARSHFAQVHEGRFRVVKIDQDKLPEFWQTLSRLGIGLFRLNNGRNPVELKVEDVQRRKPGAVIDDANAGMRNMMLRELQYGYRLRKLDPSQKGTPREQALFQTMVTMQANGLRELGLGITYVLGPKGSGGLCYTPRALDQAKKILEKRGLDESHLTPEGVQWETYEGPATLRVVNRPGQPGMEHARLCVFTDYAQAAEVRDRFAQSGHDDGILAISFEEMFAQAQQCAGILVDMPTIGLEIPRDKYQNILRFRASPGPIVIKLKQDENKPEA